MWCCGCFWLAELALQALHHFIRFEVGLVLGESGMSLGLWTRVFISLRPPLQGPSEDREALECWKRLSDCSTSEAQRLNTCDS